MKTLYESILDINNTMDRGEQWAQNRVQFFEKWKQLFEELNIWIMSQLKKQFPDPDNRATREAERQDVKSFAWSTSYPEYTSRIKTTIRVECIKDDQTSQKNLNEFASLYKRKAKSLYRKYFDKTAKICGEPSFPYDFSWTETMTPYCITMGEMLVNVDWVNTEHQRLIINLYQPIDKS